VAAGLAAIEWIYDAHGSDVNPIASDDGLAQVRALSMENDIAVRSLCADYFMDMPLLRASDQEIEARTKSLVWLLGRSAMLGVSRVVLPFVDASRIDSDAELDHVAAVLEQVLPAVDMTGVEIHLETSLSPGRFAELLTQLRHPKVMVNYDSGNSASLGYDPRDEFAAYGTRVGSVHIKDRMHGGGTVPLGSGDTNFEALFECLDDVGYRGDFVLQVARGEAGDEVSWARRNLEFVMALQADRP
jgi:hexulose-6-phosphate isomerase